jgi:hypothetical protein
VSTRFFYVVYIGEPILQIAFDAIRLIANPSEKGLAHITVRGPYPGLPHLENETLAIEGEIIRVTGVGDFFESGQNTVYLACECPALEIRWHKPDFGYKPHITLYDGPSRKFAERLRRIVEDDYVPFSFRATRLTALESQKGVKSESLRQAIDTVGLAWLLGERLSFSDIENAPQKNRLVWIERIWRRILTEFSDQSFPPNGQLFNFDALHADRQYQSCLTFQSLSVLCVHAYQSSHCGNSIDRVLADPQLNAAFVHECWKRGAHASQYELNRALLNARKEGRIGRVDGVLPFSVPRPDLEKYLLASELALRLVQDQEWFDQQRYVSLDRILSEPTLSYRFDQLARAISPGHAPSDYRWAAITLRKSQTRRSRSVGIDSVRFSDLGRLDRIRTHQVNAAPGLYWLRYGRSEFYVGNAQDLRVEFERIMSLKLRELPTLHPTKFQPPDKLTLLISPRPNESPSARDFIKSHLVRKNHPYMNVMPSVPKAL